MAEVKDGKLSDFRPQENNANAHTQRGLKALSDAYSEVGYVAPMTAAANGEVLDGSARLEQAFDQFDDEVLVIHHDGRRPIVMVRDDVSDADDPRAKKISYGANRIGEISLNWSPEQLLLDKEAGVDFSGLFYENEFDEITAEAKEEPPEPPPSPIDKAKELQEKWGVNEGDIWRIENAINPGRCHRLICGDCTDRATVEAVMRGERSELLFTSPPYGAARDYGGDDISILKLKKFISVFAEFANFMAINLGLLFKDGEVIQYWDEYIKEARSVGLKLLGWNVWDKKNSGSIASATNMFALIHEWIFVFGEKRKRLNRTIPNNLETYIQRHGEDFLSGLKNKKVRQGDGTINETTSGTYTHHQLHSVLSCDSEKSREFTDYHPAIMRIDVPIAYIEAMANKGDLVIDPFLGSGTTMVAAHQLNRTCVGIELDPSYVAVCLQRMKDIGLDPVLVENIAT